ncbi:MAG: hypothetical protein A2176_03940 [Spirochaetes bacterium RBG_13_51_14]|nr:MAG: hypothetical protein A2176_03940 [Spirochaetes bacterium RBG_13_51_14]
MDAIKACEKKAYILKKDVEIEDRKLKKGDEVKIKVAVGSTWVKIHAYPARADDLKADYLLILYLFDDDFTSKKFNRTLFDERLNAVVTEKGTPGSK